MGILPLKKQVDNDKSSFATKKRMFGDFAIDEASLLLCALCATMLMPQLQFCGYVKPGTRISASVLSFGALDRFFAPLNMWQTVC